MGDLHPDQVKRRPPSQPAPAGAAPGVPAGVSTALGRDRKSVV